MRQRVIDPDVKHESVELRLGQRIGAFLFDRVLCREHEERLFERVGSVAGGDHFFLHRLEQRGLRFRRGPVDFVGEEQVAKDRAFDEAENLFTCGLIRFEDVGADDVAGHEVGRKLHALELEVEHLGDGVKTIKTNSMVTSRLAPSVINFMSQTISFLLSDLTDS